MSYLLPLLVLVAACDRSPVLRDVPDAWVREARPDLVIALETDDGQPVRGAWVTLRPGSRDARTNALGDARFLELMPGDYEAVVAPSGFEPATFPIAVGAQDVAYRLVIDATDPGAELSGSVTDGYGLPVRGASVLLDGVEVALTDASGTYYVVDAPDGVHELSVLAPGARLGDWYVPRLEIVPGGAVALDVVLPGKPTDGATFVGSGTCLMCHGGATEAGGKWFGTAHARAWRTPLALQGTPLAAEFAEGRVIALAHAEITLSEPTPGTWRATVVFDDASTHGFDVIGVYGGHRSGAVVVVDDGGQPTLLPILWALPGQGLSSRQHVAGWVEAYGDGWFDGSTPRPSRTDSARFDLQCAGCHATGHALTGAGGKWRLVGATSSPVERAVGCEACHGPGSEHAAQPTQALRNIFNPARVPPTWRLETCARCHERVTADAHPFSATPGWPVRADGGTIGPHEVLSDHATPSPLWWAAVPASRVMADQVGELRASPHRQGPTGYEGGCEDCHDPHGSANPASLKRDPGDNALCTTCHVSAFPDLAAERAHSHHSQYASGRFGPGTCTGCHMGRSGVEVRLDAVSSVGELHAHGLRSFDPADILVEFDLAGLDQLAPGEVPVSPCLDCHLQVDAAAREVGDVCACTMGDPLYRVTYENLQQVIQSWWGVSP